MVILREMHREKKWFGSKRANERENCSYLHFYWIAKIRWSNAQLNNQKQFITDRR